MITKFGHVSIVSSSYKELADFYIKVFGCKVKPPVRDLKGPWVDSLTSIKDAHIKGIHLLLPGFDEQGPTLEIFEYNKVVDDSNKELNKSGFTHIAFGVDDVKKYIELVLQHKGSLVGEHVEATVEKAGEISVVYVRDPEGNIIELQSWSATLE
ncbi:MAG: VOC family protein [Sphaerochaetaceae bacterium]|jgi:catechol 2,3-dioxygenase-like lactoylglutathione lyase family enzyme